MEPSRHERRSRAVRFLLEVAAELTRVVWPARREVVILTIVVVATVAVLTSFVFLLDAVFARLVLRVLGG